MNRILLAALLSAVPAAVLAAAPAGVSEGYRATSLPMPDHQLRFLRAGDRVDLMTVFTIDLAEKGKKDRVTATILQNVLVLDVDREFGVILLALNPNEAQYAALFAADKEERSLWLVKRAKGDIELPPMEMASARKLFR